MKSNVEHFSKPKSSSNLFRPTQEVRRPRDKLFWQKVTKMQKSDKYAKNDKNAKTKITKNAKKVQK